MYGRENRLKVARDEEKHREEENAKLEKHLQVGLGLLPDKASVHHWLVPAKIVVGMKNTTGWASSQWVRGGEDTRADP